MRRAAPSLNRYFAALAGVALLAALVAAGAGWLQFLEERGALLRESRFQFSLNSVKGTLESGLRLGLALPDLPGAQTQIDQTRVQEQGILSIDVFDTDGRIVFTTDKNGIGANLPAAWRAPCLTPGAGWRAQDDDGHLQCSALENGYEQVAGGVLLRYRLPSRATTLDALSGRWPAAPMLAVALTLLAGLVGLASYAAWLLLRPIERRLDLLSDSIGGAGAAGDDELAGPLTAALTALAQHAENLRAVERETDRIDDLDLN